MNSINEIQEFIEIFEKGAWPNERWTHREHVVAAVWYLSEHGLSEAKELIRKGILRHNITNGITQTDDSGYHQSLTFFLTELIHDKMTHLSGSLSLSKKIESIYQELRDFKSVVLEYYSKDRIQSREARTGWLEPDIKSIKPLH